MSPRETLEEFMIEQIAAQPNERAIILYRSLAVETSDRRLSSRCRELADAIESLQRNQLNLLLDLRREKS